MLNYSIGITLALLQVCHAYVLSSLPRPRHINPLSMSAAKKVVIFGDQLLITSLSLPVIRNTLLIHLHDTVGGTGYIGKFVVKESVNRGYDTTIGTRVQ